ncbi:hypothetical protein RPC_1199 [Rhodopseudomonas palustris BisB18]|uniref:Uncharacterized protein n=1 Tax=Rhodopseudomonas palustris (strain BisB18) TaxID=316056 RepID=Q21A24_RHOPB
MLARLRDLHRKTDASIAFSRMVIAQCLRAKSQSAARANRLLITPTPCLIRDVAQAVACALGERGASRRQYVNASTATALLQRPHFEPTTRRPGGTE